MKWLRLVPVAVLLLIAFNAFADGRGLRPVTIDDVQRFRVIVNVSANPVGSDLVVQVMDYDGGPTYLMDLWWIRPGSNPVRLTTGGATKGSYAYAPDGKSIVFAGTRNGKQGIQKLPLGGGEAETLAELALPVSNLRYVGDRITFTAGVFPDCKADFNCTAQRHKTVATGTSARVYTELGYRPWNSWADGTHSALFSMNPATGAVEELAVGEFDVPLAPFGGLDDYAVSPDGKVVYYSAKKVADPFVSTNDDIFEIADGTTRKITENAASDRTPKFSPDGRWVAYLAQSVPGFESDRIRLKLYDRKTGEHSTLTDSLDNWVMEFVWAPDGQSLIATIGEQGHLLLYQIPLDKALAPKRLSGRFVDRHLAVGGDGGLYFTRETFTQLPELHRMDLATGEVVKLTDFNGPILAELAMPTVEEIWWDGALKLDGTRNRVHGFLLKPAGVESKKPLPLVVMIHGGPQGAWNNAFHPRWTPLGVVGHGYAVALPNPTGSFGYGQDFVNGVSKDWGGKAFDDIMAMMEFLKGKAGVDVSRACAMGGSYGGYMTNWLEAKTDSFKCLISHSGVSHLEMEYSATDELWFPEWDIGGKPWENPEAYRKWSPMNYVRDFKTPMMVIHGANDFRVPLDQGIAMFQALRRTGIDAKLVVYPDEDHFVNRPVNRKFWYDTVVEWLDKYTK